MKSKNLLGLDEKELMAFAEGLGAKPFRGKQLYQQIYKRHELDFAFMTDLALPFRQQLAKNAVMAISARKITVSTSGVVPVVRKLTQYDKIPNLAVSLNATTARVRSRIMPINDKWPLGELLGACRKLAAGDGRRITFEYVLLGGENDSDEDACRLRRRRVAWLQGARRRPAQAYSCRSSSGPRSSNAADMPLSGAAVGE